jgi:folate-binding protein YgfZ
LKPQFVDLSARVKLRVSGVDAERFLNGQLTNDVRKATDTQAIEACVLNAKGKMNAHIFLARDGASFLLDADPKLRDSLPVRLERYIIADDVRIEDVTDQLSIFHLLGQLPPDLPNEYRTRATTRLNEEGAEIWIDAAKHDQTLQQLSERFAFCDDACAEALRIEQGIPRWGHELTEEIIPVEAGLESRTIDYEKGCYIGQEVISRMKMSGQTNKRLCGLISAHGSPLAAGMKLFPMGAETKEAGWITSSCRSDRLDREIALGFVKRGFAMAGAKLDALPADNLFGSPVVRVEVVDLPFVPS